MRALTAEEEEKWLSNRQGKDFILFQGLLHLAHEAGLYRTKLDVVQLPNEANGQTAVMLCTGIFKVDGKITRVHQEIGDANERNVGRMIAMHIIRMASTRATARMLRIALDVGYTALEELSDEDQSRAQRKADRQAQQQAQPAQQARPTPVPRAPEPPKPRALTHAHSVLIRVLREQLQQRYGSAPELPGVLPRTADEAERWVAFALDQHVKTAPDAVLTPEQKERLSRAQAAFQSQGVILPAFAFDGATVEWWFTVLNLVRDTLKHQKAS